MNFKEILELIDKVAESGIAGVEVEQAGTKLRIEGKVSKPPALAPQSGERSSESAAPMPMPAATTSAAPAAAGDAAGTAGDPDAGLHIITSPIVGTFYRSPNPESASFVNVGDKIEKGKVLCIIEAMKLMNEIEADISGVIARVYPQNGQPIEYGEKLFAVKV